MKDSPLVKYKWPKPHPPKPATILFTLLMFAWKTFVFLHDVPTENIQLQVNFGCRSQ